MPGRWGTHVNCSRCWLKLSRRCSKEALLAIKAGPCHFAVMTEDFKRKSAHDVRSTHPVQSAEGRRLACLAVVCSPPSSKKKLRGLEQSMSD